MLCSLRDESELHPAFAILGSLVDVESLSLELDDVKLLEADNVGVRQSLDPVFGDRVEDGRKVIIALNLLLVDQVVIIDEDDRNKVAGRLRQPMNLLRSLLDISLEMELKLDALDLATICFGDFPDVGVTPIHGSNFLVVAEQSAIVLLHQELRGEDSLLVTNLGVLLVGGQSPGLRLLRTSLDVDFDPIRARMLSFKSTKDHSKSTYKSSSATAQYRGAIGSKTFLFQAHS